jgi:hypothetical protein
VPPEALSSLTSMGFTDDQAKAALKVDGRLHNHTHIIPTSHVTGRARCFCSLSGVRSIYLQVMYSYQVGHACDIQQLLASVVTDEQAKGAWKVGGRQGSTSWAGDRANLTHSLNCRLTPPAPCASKDFNRQCQCQPGGLLGCRAGFGRILS